MQLLAFTDASGNHHEARRWDPNGYGCGCSRPPRGSPAPHAATLIHLARDGAWTDLLLKGITRLRQLAAPG
jgi:hypothetical protein